MESRLGLRPTLQCILQIFSLGRVSGTLPPLPHMLSLPDCSESPCSYIYRAASPCCCRVILFFHLLSCILINKMHSLVKEHKSATWWEDEILTQSERELQNILETVLVTGITLPIGTVCISRSSAVSVTWLFSPIGQVLSQRWNSQLKDQVYDNVLPVKDYYTPHMAATDECGTVVGRWIIRRKTEEILRKISFSATSSMSVR
jgi:hypothetical protein